MNDQEKVLRLTFHGRIIDHLGIQMYQSPVAAVAELVSNAWDADAEKVEIQLPERIEAEDAQLSIKDNGVGMTFRECQDRFLNVGWCRRGTDPDEKTSEKGRPVLGRKGIGKFAGFGIAEIIRIETVSKETGEKTVFELNIDDLRSDEYVAREGAEITVLEHLSDDEKRKNQHGTKIVLKKLKLTRRPSRTQFAKSMARRFLLHQRSQDFQVLVDGQLLPGEDNEGVEFVFPAHFKEEEKPEGLNIEGQWGVETLSNGQKIKWRVFFYKRTIEEEELRGIAVFSRGKLAQKPFFFNLTGGLGGQHGQEYMSGQVEADYIDALDEDIIATERQRISWEHRETLPLEEWGQKCVKTLLRVWRDRRGEKRRQAIESKLDTFSGRLDRLKPHEQKTIKRALIKIGSIPTLTDEQFFSLGEALLLSWEQGRLHELIDTISQTEDISEKDLLNLLIESEVLTALNTAEAVKTKLLTVGGLKLRIQRKDLELAVRNFIAENPWLISPEWETFQVERSLSKLTKDAAGEAGFTGPDWEGRVDLALSSGEHVLILEFMRPGLCINWDHVSRFEQYVLVIRTNLEATTGSRFKKVTGYIVADALGKKPFFTKKLLSLENNGMFALDWETLFERACAAWNEFLEILVNRTPEDERLRALLEDRYKNT